MSQVWDLNQNHTYACIYVYEYICGLWRKIGMWTHACSESPDCELQDAPIISAIGARGESIWSTQSRSRAKSPCLRTPPGILEFLREIGLWTHACSESPDCELQDAPIISAIGARGESKCSTQSRLRAKSPHFDGVVHVLFTGLRNSMANRICTESPFHVVFENTITSKIRFILGSLHHFWSKRCDFCGVRHLLRSKVLMHWKALNNQYNWY